MALLASHPRITNGPLNMVNYGGNQRPLPPPCPSGQDNSLAHKLPHPCKKQPLRKVLESDLNLYIPLGQASNLDILKKNQGRKNSKLKEKTQ